jgi:hypothetical protein
MEEAERDIGFGAGREKLARGQDDALAADATP